jgi:hypothetical protein
MDCEGAEYDIFGNVDEHTLGCIERIVLEYHPHPNMDVRGIADKLGRAGFAVTVRPEISLVYATRRACEKRLELIVAANGRPSEGNWMRY